MIIPKRLSAPIIAVAAVGLFFVQPVRALTAIAQPHVKCIEHASIGAVQPIGHQLWQRYHSGRRDYHRGWRGYSRPSLKYNHYRSFFGYGGVDKTWRRYGYYPWGGSEPCANCPAFK